MQYVVQKGDTLYSISKKYNVSVSDLSLWNQLTSTVLQIGQVLNVSPSNNDYYIVQKGDTLYSIAKRYGVSVSDLISINQLSSSILSIGQKLYFTSSFSSDIPVGSSCFGEGYSDIKYETYTVKKGDSLYAISKKYGVSVDTLKKINQLSGNGLSIGQVLKVKEVS